MTQPDHDQPLTFPARIAALAGAADSALSLDVDLLLRGQCASLPPPDWFGDLSAVVAEVERRGYRLSVRGQFYDAYHGVYYWNAAVWQKDATERDALEIVASTPCLALLSALVEAVEGER